MQEDVPAGKIFWTSVQTNLRAIQSLVQKLFLCTSDRWSALKWCVEFPSDQAVHGHTRMHDEPVKRYKSAGHDSDDNVPSHDQLANGATLESEIVDVYSITKLNASSDEMLVLGRRS